MILKAAVIFFLSTVLFISPALAIESSFDRNSEQKQIIRTGSETKVVQIKNKIGTREAVISKKIETRIIDIREIIASREAELKIRLNKFKDKKKAGIAERLNRNLNNINQNRTDEMSKNLEKMSGILDRLETRAGKTTEITESRALIASASSAVKDQAQKDYTVTVTTEKNIKTDLGKVMTQLQQDLRAVRKQVIDAKQSVAYAIRKAKPNGTK